MRSFKTNTFLVNLILLASISVIYSNRTQAIQLADGTVHFAKGPDLVAATTTFKETNVWGATYFFTIKVPENAGEPLQRVSINQIGGVDNIRYRLKETYAFEGDHWHEGSKVTLGNVTLDEKNNKVDVIFTPAVSPGKTVTITLRPVRNPFSDGVYLFGVTAYPAGERSYGLYLGVGRMHFYRWN